MILLPEGWTYGYIGLEKRICRDAPGILEFGDDPGTGGGTVRCQSYGVVHRPGIQPGAVVDIALCYSECLHPCVTDVLSQLAPIPEKKHSTAIFAACIRCVQSVGIDLVSCGSCGSQTGQSFGTISGCATHCSASCLGSKGCFQCSDNHIEL